jgi:hypothetical protein
LLAAKFIAASRADFEVGGFAISFVTLARAASLDSFVTLLFMHLP